ncbi:MAG: hypothetical protein K2N35_04290 [Muribaculaceae bacterium]|nr:hypothetical protein [Muribaculaceae bacterium]
MLLKIPKFGVRRQFADGCYVYSSCSTKTKMSIIRYIFTKLNIQPSDLEFELTPLTDPDPDSTSDTNID